MTKQKSITATELMARLNADPEFVAREAKEEAERLHRAFKLGIAETPLRDDLRAAGYAVDSAWDLVNTERPYPSALPILVQHLQREYPTEIREGIARALAVPDANFAWGTLTEIYRREPHGRVKEGLAAALAGAAAPPDMENLIALIRDPRNGESRILLLGGLERSHDPRAMAALLKLQAEADQQLTKQIGLIMQRLEQKRRRRALRAKSKKPDQG